MKRYEMRVIRKVEVPYIVEAESAQEALERISLGLAEPGDEWHAEPDVHIRELEG